MANQYQEQLNNVMAREVSRGEFLKLVGVAMLGVVGFVGFLKHLHEVPPQTVSRKHSTSGGYGGSAYGR